MEASGLRCELRVWQERYKKDGRREIVAQDGLEPEIPDGDKAYAIVVRKVMTEKNVLDHTNIQTNSPHILKAYRDVVKSYPTVPSNFETPFEMESPFQMLYHYWDDLDAYRRTVSDDTARMHLNLLFELMRAELGHEKAQCDGMIESNQIRFSRLWTIFRPGDIQYTSENGYPWLLRLQKTAYEENNNDGKFLEVHCSYIDYDGARVGKAPHVIKLLQKVHFAAENPSRITDLEIFPRKFLEGLGDLEAKLSNRGLRFLELRGVSVRRYDGLAQYLKNPRSDYWHPSMAIFPLIWFNYTVRCLVNTRTGPSDEIVILRKLAALFLIGKPTEKSSIKDKSQSIHMEMTALSACFSHRISTAIR